MRALLFAATAVALVACTKAEAPPKTGTLEPIELPQNHPPMTPLPDPDLNGGHIGRAPRRLTVAQLGANIVGTTGRQWSQLQARSASLGQADYALVNAEGTEPNLVFAKFLEDGAREVCLAVAQDDLAKPNQADRILSSEVPASISDLTKIPDEAVKANLVTLSIRFWGQPLSGTELDSWAQTFKGIAVRAQTNATLKRQAWGAMCIAFMTDQRFFTY